MYECKKRARNKHTYRLRLGGRTRARGRPLSYALAIEGGTKEIVLALLDAPLYRYRVYFLEPFAI